MAKSFGSGDPARIAPAEMAEQLSRLKQTSQHVEAAALVEEMVARTHERAAALYESWAHRRGQGGVEGLEDRAQAHRELAAVARSVERLAERALDGFQARVEAGTTAIGKPRSLRTLAAWGRLRILISERIAGSVAMSRREGATWAEIAAALGVTRQTAHQRFRADNEPDR